MSYIPFFFIVTPLPRSLFLSGLSPDVDHSEIKKALNNTGLHFPPIDDLWIYRKEKLNEQTNDMLMIQTFRSIFFGYGEVEMHIVPEVTPKFLEKGKMRGF